MKKSEINKLGLRAGNIIAYTEANNTHSRVKYVQILDDKFFGKATYFSRIPKEVNGRTVFDVDNGAQIKDALIVADVAVKDEDSGDPTVIVNEKRGRLMRAREFDRIVKFGQRRELIRLVEERNDEWERQLRQRQTERKEKRETEDAARAELAEALEGTGIIAPYGRDAVRALAIAKAYHEAMEKK